MANLSCACRLILATAVFFLLGLICVPSTFAQQTGKAKTEPEATLFPVPDFSSDIWQRAKLTGDWFGLRTKMADNGVQLDVDNVDTFQGVSGGGLDTTGRYLGNAEIVLKLDSQKMGFGRADFCWFAAKPPSANSPRTRRDEVVSPN